MKLLRVVLVAAALMGLGCFKVEQTLQINKDGSGSLDLTYGMSEQTVSQMEAMKQMAANMGAEGEMEEDDSETPFDFNEDEVREKFKELEPKGIKLESVSSELKDGWKYMHIKLAFKDLQALSETDFFDDSSLSLTRNADGNYVLVQKSDDYGMEQPGAEGDEDMPPEMQDMMLKQMAPMLAGMRVAMTVVTPMPILETNGDKEGDDKVTWVYDIDKDPDVLMKMKKSDLKVVFSGKGVDLPEINASADDD